MPIVLAVTGLVACGPSLVNAPPGPVPTTLSPPLDTLGFYVGSWSCKGTSFGEHGKPDEQWDARIDVAPELGGKWLSVQMTGPGDSRTAEHKGYDPTTKKWAHLAVVNDGSWGTMTSPGWTGSHMVFTPDDKDDHTHATFSKLGERSYSHAVTRETEHGEEKVWEKICTKR
jgi:hypothetical protein